MKYIVASDIHGSIYSASFLCDRIKEFAPEKVILLGDIYDGNNFKEIDALLKKIGVTIECVEGNCDNRYTALSSLNFVGSNIIEFHNGRRYFFTHGHIYNRYNIPESLSKGDILIYGHTHVGVIGEENGINIVNAGSVGRPRETSKRSFILINDDIIELRELEFGDLIEKLELK